MTDTERWEKLKQYLEAAKDRRRYDFSSQAFHEGWFIVDLLWRMTEWDKQ